MKIQSFDVRTVLVPMTPHRTASGVVTASPLVLLRVRTDSGEVGSSMIFTYTPAAQKPCADLIRNCEALVAGQELAPSAIFDALNVRFRLLGAHGLVAMAISAIDMALWDALARSKQMSLHALLGAKSRPLRFYGGIGFDGVLDSARTAEFWAKSGARGVKAKIGYPRLKDDIDVIRAMRAAVGPDVAIMVDYNQSLDVVEAERRVRALDCEGLEWIEEPVLAHDFAALARLGELSATPLQAGENWWGPLDFRHAIDSGSRELLMIDPMKGGGVTGWMRIAALAQSRSMPVSNHLWPEISAQLMLATPTAGWFEYVDWWSPILREPLRLSGADAVVGDSLGTGVDFDDHAIERFAV